MTNFADKRKYQRCSSTVCKILMSGDGKTWENMELIDISAGGLSYTSKKGTCHVNDTLNFDLCVYNMLSEFNMRLEGHVVRKVPGSDSHVYGVKFDNMNKYNRVQLDELVRSRVTINSSDKSAMEDGVYTCMFIPNGKLSKARIYK